MIYLRKHLRIALILFFIVLATGCSVSSESNNDKEVVEDTIRELKSGLFNPEELQVHDVIIANVISEDDEEVISIMMDYSGMNKMGGFSRDHYYTRFIDGVYEEEFTETGFTAEIAYTIYEKAIKDKEDDEFEAYHFDLESIDVETIK